jgi:nucleotide-binding universal stress UspA family protein
MASEGDARPPAVVGVDGSDQSVAALRWAVRYGAATGTPVRAVLAWH